MTQPMSDEVRATIADELNRTKFGLVLESQAYGIMPDEIKQRIARIDTAAQWIAQQAAQPPRVQPDAHLAAWCEDALEVIARGVELMPLEQLSQWTGVRHVQEMYEAAQRGAYLREVQPQPRVQPYSHRNGETEPPTIEGDFWFAGNLHHYEANYWHNTRTLLRVERHWRTGDLFLPGEECNHELTDAEGQWYGPITPPWEQPATAQESSNDELAQHWPQMPELDGVDLFADYPVTGGSQDE